MREPPTMEAEKATSLREAAAAATTRMPLLLPLVLSQQEVDLIHNAAPGCRPRAHR